MESVGQICNCISVQAEEIGCVKSEDEAIGAHGGGIPPGWDFPEARDAAEQGLDLWLLDTTYRQTPMERLRAVSNGAQTLAMIRRARRNAHES